MSARVYDFGIAHAGIAKGLSREAIVGFVRNQAELVAEREETEPTYPERREPEVVCLACKKPGHRRNRCKDADALRRLNAEEHRFLDERLAEHLAAIEAGTRPRTRCGHCSERGHTAHSCEVHHG